MNDPVEVFKFALDDYKSLGKGTLIGFGINYEELARGVGIYSTAIVRMPGGNVLNVPVEDIEFLGVA